QGEPFQLRWTTAPGPLLLHAELQATERAERSTAGSRRVCRDPRHRAPLRLFVLQRRDRRHLLLGLDHRGRLKGRERFVDVPLGGGNRERRLLVLSSARGGGARLPGGGLGGRSGGIGGACGKRGESRDGRLVAVTPSKRPRGGSLRR